MQHGTPVVLTIVLLIAGVVVAEDAPRSPTADVERVLDDPPATGLLVTRVVEGSPADRAGLIPGLTLVAYQGQEVPTLAALLQARVEVGDASVEVTLVRPDGTRFVVGLPTGRMGLALAEVTQGEPAPALPEATAVAFDLAPLADGPRDDWYAFVLDGTHCGFEHGLLRREGDRIISRREVAFDGGEAWGLQHFDVTIETTADPVPRLLRLEYVMPLSRYEGHGTLLGTADGTLAWRFRYENAQTGESGARELTVPDDLPVVPTYLVEVLASLMPREAAACFHYRPIEDGTGHVLLPAALYCVGSASVAAEGSSRAVWHYEVRSRTAYAAGNAFWVDADRRTLRSTYGGPEARRTTKAEALAGLHEALVPRSAD